MPEKILKGFWIVLAIAVLTFGITVFTSWYSNGWESLSTIYVKYDGEPLKRTATLTAESKAEISVRSAGFLNKTEDYSVRIIPNVKSGFKYTLNGEEKKYLDIEDLTDLFKLTVNGDAFTVDLTDFSGEPQVDMKRLLLRYHGEGAEVEITDELNKAVTFFTLEVTSADGLYKTKVNFNVLTKQIKPDGIELDPDKVVL